MSTPDLRASHSGNGNHGKVAGADPKLPGEHPTDDTHWTFVAGDPSTRNGQAPIEPQSTRAVAGSSPDLAISSAVLTDPPPDRDHSPQPANLEPLPIFEASAGAPTSPVANHLVTTTELPPPGTQDCGDHGEPGNHQQDVAAPTPPGPATDVPDSNPLAPVLADPLLALAADVLDDLERVRIANENRLRQLTRDETDKDGEERGFGLTTDHPDVARLAALVDALAKAEHDATLNLRRMMRAHPLGPWVKAAKGIGEKQGARLLAAIGDPYWNDLHNRPRTVSELWSYCGYHVLSVGHKPAEAHLTSANGESPSARHTDSANHTASAGGTQLPTGHSGFDTRFANAGGDGSDPGHPSSGPSVGVAAPLNPGRDPGHRVPADHATPAGIAATPQRGQRANWNAAAKMRARLIAESCIKVADSPYRAVYDEGRAKYADAVHAVECKRCGPAGKPAQPGTPISAGHQHARSLRLVSKTILRDLWREAKRIHEGGDE